MTNVQKILRNGSSAAITIRAEMMRYLGWKFSEVVAVVLLDNNTILVRRATGDDLKQHISPRLGIDAPPVSVR